MRHYRSFISWLRSWILLAPLALAGCAAPLVHQRNLAALHTRAASTCRAKPAQCVALAPCSFELRQGLSAWQGVSAAIAQGEDGAAPLANALIAEGTARVTCLAQGVK